MNLTLMYFAKRLPRFIYKPLSQLYVKWSTKVIWDEELIENIMEYFNLDDYDVTLRMLETGSKQLHNHWCESNPESNKEIINFYKKAPSQHVFALASWHMTRGQINFRNKIMKYCSGDVLDYGGGVGDLCIKLAEKGINVTYGDISKANMEFAKWLFKKRGYEIKVLDLENEIDLLEKYDTILCIDVIEHIPHSEVVLERMARHLRNNGRLIITKLNYQGDANPTHLKKNFDEKILLKELGLKGHYDWLWIKRGE